MEKMKRLLCAVLALTLVLGMVPGVPMTAGAEELETQPETVAVETTEAAAAAVETTAAETTVPETAAPEVTEPAETIPQETVPAQTVAEETAPAETVPAQTEEETVPVETVAEETAPEETVEELEASAEEAGAYEEVAPVDSIQVVVSDERTYLGDRVKLSAVVSPENVVDPSVTWVIDGAEITNVLEDGSVLITTDTPGIVEVYAVSNELPEKEGQEPVRSEVAYVTFLEYWMEVNLLGLDEENRFDEEDANYNTACRMKTGETIELNAKYLTRLLPEDQAGHDRDFKVESLSEPDITWSLNDGAQEYVSMTVSPTDPTVVTLQAKTVTQTYTVTLTARDRIAGTHSVEVVVYPEPYKVMVEAGQLPESMGWDADTNTLTVNLNAMADADFEAPVELSAKLYPLEAPQTLTWECSDGIISLKDPDEDEKTTDQMLLYVTDYSGTSTVTVASAEDPEISTRITVKRVRVMSKDRLTLSLASSKITDMIAGETKTFTAIDNLDKEILESNVVEWSLPVEEDHAYASITAAGRLTVKDIAVGKVITLRCSIIDHPDPEAYIEYALTVHPKATKVELLPGTLPSDKYAEDFVCNDETLYVNAAYDVQPFMLAAQVLPGNDSAIGALQKVTWKSSNTSIATIHPDTNEIIWKGKTGVTTITATAADGSGKKASVKLNFCLQADGIEIILPGLDYVRSGGSLPLDVKLTPDRVDAASKKTSVTWKIVGCDLCGDKAACATISTAGKITAKTVYENHTITVTAATKDGSELVSEPVTVTIKPKKDGALILKSGGDYVTKTTRMVNVEDGISLEAYSLYDGVGEIGEDVTWKSSNKAIATVDESGYVEVLRAGQVTITATATDGSKRTATVVIKGVKMVSEIEITVKNDQSALASGKSMTLKATPYFDSSEGTLATIRKINWSLSEGAEKVATITAAGRLTAVKNYVGEPVDITVYASATDGSGVTAEYTVTICPAVQGVKIDTGAFQRKGTTYLYQLGSVPEYMSLSAVTYPETASQDVTWKSSSKAIAEVDAETGDLTIHKAGTVTITATANDGSGKSASFKLKVVRAAADITFTNVHVCPDGNMVVAGGKSLTPVAVLWDADGNKITGRSLKWRIDDYEGDDDNGLAYASISSKGVLSTKKVSEMKSVLVTVWTVEELDTLNSLVYQFRVDIYPATSSVQLVREVGGESVEVTTTLYVKTGETLDLDAVSYTQDPNAKAAQVWDWKTSNKKTAVVDENGVVTGLKAGTVTITVTAKDGTGKKDTVKIIVQD